MIRKAFVIVLASLSGFLLAVWPWSYFKIITLPGARSWGAGYPYKAARGEWVVLPRFSEGLLRIRYCTVVPGGPLISAHFGPVLGIRYDVVTDTRFKAGTFVDRMLYAPIWMLLLLTLPYPIMNLVRGYRPYSRHKKGLCRQCGYDLTGNVSGRCPECGTAIGRAGGGR